MIEVEKGPGASPAYWVTWGGKRASRSFTRVSQAYVIQWAVLNTLLIDYDDDVSCEKMKDDTYFYRTVLKLLEKAVEKERLPPAYKEILQDEMKHLQKKLNTSEAEDEKEGNTSEEASSEESEREEKTDEESTKQKEDAAEEEKTDEEQEADEEQE